MLQNNNEDKKPLGHCQHKDEELKLHELHQKQEEQLHQEHLKEEEVLHKAHVEEEEFLRHEHENEEKDDCIAKITVDGKSVEIERGPEAVATIKIKGGVPAAYTLLEENTKGQFLPLADDATVCIKGCEVFESHAPCGGSS